MIHCDVSGLLFSIGVAFSTLVNVVHELCCKAKEMWPIIAGDVYFYTVCLPWHLRMCCLQCICAQIRLLQTMKMWLVEFLRNPLCIFFACLGLRLQPLFPIY